MVGRPGVKLLFRRSAPGPHGSGAAPPSRAGPTPERTHGSHGNERARQTRDRTQAECAGPCPEGARRTSPPRSPLHRGAPGARLHVRGGRHAATHLRRCYRRGERRVGARVLGTVRERSPRGGACTCPAAPGGGRCTVLRSGTRRPCPRRRRRTAADRWGPIRTQCHFPSERERIAMGTVTTWSSH